MPTLTALIFRQQPTPIPGFADAGSSGSVTPDATAAGAGAGAGAGHPLPPLHHHHEVHVTTRKVCTQRLPLPDGAEVVHAVPAVGHLSSSSIYPACLAPYVMVTACTDSVVRWEKGGQRDGGGNRFG